ncbi:MAG: permease [Rhodospirillales bacterium]|nr:MAG: permease [Rhodospirillales bacterium]
MADIRFDSAAPANASAARTGVTAGVDTDAVAAPAPRNRLRRLAAHLARIDRVVLAFAAIIAALALIDPPQAGASLAFTLDSLTFIAPFLAASVLIAATAKATGADGRIAQLLDGHPAATIAVAALFGALSPFCSCGVVPVVAALLGAGVPLAPVMAFWISSPIMDPEMFILTAAVIGLPFAVAKTLAAIGMGLIAGFATHALAGRAAFASPLRAGAGGCCASSCATKAKRQAPAPIVWRFWPDPARRAVFASEARAAGWFLGKWLALAFLIESLMIAWIPGETVAAYLGGAAWWAIPAAALAGIPAYLNGFAAIPTVAALMELGMAPGAALTFMVAGAVTSIPAAMAVYALARRPVFLWYLALGLAGALASGVLYQAVA